MPINSSLIKLYHGSPYPNIEKFEITARTRRHTDYGLGVYFTTNREQAKKVVCERKCCNTWVRI